MEKAQKVTQFKAISIAILVHLGLVGSLVYMNTENPKELLPEFVKEWVKGDSNKEVVANREGLP